MADIVRWVILFLLPVAALSGWLAAHKHYKKKLRKQESPFNPEYFKGLNYLLNEQPDKAIDVFIRLLEVNSETVDTHLALANLFRRRGETERAIRIHQNLIARPSLSLEQRSKALMELGMDYMHAGVLDRAEHLFLELLENNQHPIVASKQLLRIYQQEKNWQQAIAMAQRHQKSTKKDMSSMVAQFYCELAEMTPENDLKEVNQLIKHAQSHDQNCVRASLLSAKLSINAGHHQKALKTLQYIEQQDSQYLPEALPYMLEIYHHTNKFDEFDQWLQQVLKRQPMMTAARIMLANIIKQQQGTQAAQDFLNKELLLYPSIEGLHTLLDLGSDNNPGLIPLIQSVTNILVIRGHRYTCKHCGFSGKILHWHCPGCGQWGNITPTEIHLSALETLLVPSK